MFRKHRLFDNTTKELIARARDIAVDLGDKNITNRHFFLADWAVDESYSSQKLFFKTVEEFRKVYEAERVAGESTLDNSLYVNTSLTSDAEAAIRGSVNEMKRYNHKKVYPFHLLLAVSHFEETYLAEILKPSVSVYAGLLEYYKKEGFIPEKPKQPNIFYRLFWMREGEY